MRILPLGERACLLSDLGARAHEVARAIEALAPEGMEEVVASFDSVGVYFDPDVFRLESLDQPLSLSREASRDATEHVIPVCYALGEDLEEVAERLRTSPAEVARLHAEGRYECLAIGFCPGFPYLGPLPAPLAGLPRRPEPRPRVDAGAVGMTGNVTGIYTLDRPGGWWLIGRTPLQLVDVASDYFPIAVGDFVRFQAIDEGAFERLRGSRL
ncbi:MAG: allophanate hydrolase subunit 1 [Fimbriimonadaceae bacterium]|nr:allophanate hydrolase subunit 1 [Fimbriimonadaceae bacterium]